MKTLVVGDKFIAARYYLDAFTRDAAGEIDAYQVDWSVDKSRQHEIQQMMELSGANAVATPEEMLGAVGGMTALCVHFAPVGKTLLDAATGLRLIAVARAGLENIDVATATERGIGVVPAHGRNIGAVAELQIGLMLSETRNIARASASITGGGWRKTFPGPQVEIADSTVGMVGFGRVGQTFARRLAGFAPRMLAYDPYAADADLAAHGVSRAATLEQVCSESDFVVIMAWHTPETDRMVGREQLALMKPHAYFINVSRSRLVDDEALLELLQQQRIAGAGLDVFDQEPLEAQSPWRSLDNVTMTTHFGGDTESTNRTSAGIVAAAVVEYRRTGKVRHAVNARKLGWDDS